MATNPNNTNPCTQDWRQSCAAFLAAMRREHPNHETPPDENGRYADADLHSTIARGPTRRDVMCSAVAMSGAAAVSMVPTSSQAGNSAGAEPELWPLWLEWKRLYAETEAKPEEDAEHHWDDVFALERRIALTQAETVLGVAIKMSLWQHLAIGKASPINYGPYDNMMAYAAWQDALQLADCREDELLDGRSFA